MIIPTDFFSQSLLLAKVSLGISSFHPLYHWMRWQYGDFHFTEEGTEV